MAHALIGSYMNRHILIVLSSMSLALVACDKNDKASETTTTSAALPADNTGTNRRDMNLDGRGNDAPTPLDQSNAQPDIDVTQNIRKALMDDDALSAEAKNVKVITNGGAVVLRGVVKSESERLSVGGHAQKLAGGNRVDNELAVAP